jgi:PAS domain S-box-containing protein
LKQGAAASVGFLSPEYPRSAPLRYGLAVAAVAAALLVRWPLLPLFGGSVPFMFFFPAIMFAGWLGGLGPGLLATGLSALGASYFLFLPQVPLASRLSTRAFQLLIFLAIGVLITLLNERLHVAWRRAAEAGEENRRQAEALLRARENALESEARFRIVADAAPVLIWMAGPDKLCDWFNRPWLAFTGRTLEQEAGNGWLEGVHPDDLDGFLETYAAAFDARQPFSLEYRLRHHDGEYRWLLDNGTPRFGPGGELSGYIGSGFDITDRRQAEQERTNLLEETELARRAAEAASRSKDEFLATVSHEVRTPLNAILGWAQLLLTGELEAEKVRRGLETISRNAKLQAQLIDDLLDVSRIISGKMRLDVRPLDLVMVIDAALEAIQPAVEAKQIRLRKVLDPLTGLVAGDPARLQQVVWNLLSNAVKFTPRNGSVEVRLERVSSHLEIIVADNGPGIPADFLPHVFDRFRQHDASTTRRQGGLGLGLAIVRHLVELHGGSVWAKSPGEGQGSTFVVRLPVSIAHLTPDDGQRVHPRADSSGDPRQDDGFLNLRGIRVLVVDDEPDARETLEQILEHCGAEVITVSSAAEALKALESWRPDVLLSDIGMPGEDGYGLIRRVRALPTERGGRTPAAALTAFARGEDRRRALNAGFQIHVSKPVEVNDLAAVVASLAKGLG